MVLLFSFFFCSGGFLVAHAEEPFAPIYIMNTINLRNGENYSFNGDGIATFEAGFNTSSGQKYGSFYFNKNTKAFNNNGSFSGVTGGYLRVGNMDGSYIFKKDQVYVIRMSFSFGGNVLDPTSLTFFDSSWSRPYTVVSSRSDMLCFYPTEDFQLNRSTFNFSFPSSIDIVNSSLGVRYLSVQALVGFTRDSSSSDIIAAIQNQTGQLDQSITDAGQGVQDKIESQFDTSQGSEVGSAAQGFADQAAESLGVVSYVDTLFSGLSGLVTAGSTTLTFPAFAIAVQGTDYQVWQEHTFDLSQLDGWFSGLMAAVRLATSVVVVGAVIHYLQSVYKDVIG